MQKGAYSYILKPFDNEQLILYVNKAVTMFRVVKENRLLRSAVEDRYSFGNLIGKSKGMQDIFETIRKVAPATATVLIEGQSGTGKELVAKSIHFNSPRRNQALCGGQLLCTGREPFGERTVRARKRCLHRGRINEERAIRAGRPGDPVSG